MRISRILSVIFLMLDFTNEKCQEKIIFETEILNTIEDKAIFVGTNDLNTKLPSVYEFEYFKFEPVFKLNNPNNLTAIQVIQAQSKASEFKLQYCSLMFEISIREYIIFCRDGFKSYLIDNQLDFDFERQYTISITKTEDYFCEYLFQDSNLQFFLICFSDFQFTLISINEQNQTFVELEYKYSVPSLSQCKRQITKIENFIIITYCKCPEWIIFTIYNLNVVWWINRHISNTQEILMNIQSCQILKETDVFLQFQQGYSTLIIAETNFTFIQEFIIVKGLLFMSLEDCKPIFGIQENSYQIIRNTVKNKDKIFNLDTSSLLIQQFLYQGMVFFLQYQNKLTIILPSSQQWDYNYSLLFFKSIDQTNYFYAYDVETNNIIFFHLQTNQQVKDITKLYYMYKYIIEISPLSFFEEQIITKQCIELRIVKEDQESIILGDLANKIQFSREDQTNLFFSIQKTNFQYTQPINLQIKSQFGLLTANDQINQELFCNIDSKILNSFGQFQIIFFEEVYHLIFQSREGLIFHNCGSGHFQKFTIQATLNQLNVILHRNILILLSYDHYNLLIFSYTAGIIQMLNKQVFDDYIIQIGLTKRDQFYIQFSRNYLIQYYDIWKNKFSIPTFHIHSPIKKQILYYQEYGNIHFIQVKNEIYLFENNFNSKKQFCMMNIPDMEIILIIQPPKTFCLIGVLDKENKIVKYCRKDNLLIENSRIPLFEYQIIRPINYSIFQDYIVIAVQKDEKKYLMIIFAQSMSAISVKNIIGVYNFQFCTFQGKLFYKNENNIFSLHNLQEYEIQIESNLICNNLQPYYHLTIKAISIVNSTNYIHANTLIQTIGCCSSYIHVKNKTTNIIMKGNQQIIEVSQILQGQVSSLAIKQNLQNQNIFIIGPFHIQQGFSLCSYYGELLCVEDFNQEYTSIYLSINDVPTSIQLEFGNDNQILFIKKQQKDQSLLIAMRRSNFLCFYTYQKFQRTFVLHKKQCSEQIDMEPSLDNKKYYFSGNMCILSFLTYKLIVNLEPIQILGKINIKQELIFVEMSNDQYLFVEYCKNPCINLIQLKKFENSQFSISQNLSLDQPKFNNFLEKMNISGYNFQITSTAFISSYLKNSEIIVQLLYIGHYEFSFLVQFAILNSEIKSFIIMKVIRHSLPFSLIFLDDKFLIVKNSLDQNLCLYDFKGPNYIIDSIYQTDQYENIFPYDSNHYLFLKKNREIEFGQLGYAIGVHENSSFSQNQSIIFIAKNKISSVEFDVAIIFEIAEIKGITIASTNTSIFLLIIIFIAFLILLVRRYILKKLAKTQLI